MIIRKIYYGRIPIRRVYLHGKLFWWTIISCYSSGLAEAAMATDARANTAAGALGGGYADIVVRSLSSPSAEEVSPVLLMLTVAGTADGRADAIGAERSQGYAGGELSTYASPITYGIVWGSGHGYGKDNIWAHSHTADIVPSSGNAGITGGGEGGGQLADVAPGRGQASGSIFAFAGANTQEPETVRMAANCVLSTAAGAVSAKAERTKAIAVGELTVQRAGAVGTYKDAELELIISDEDGNVFILVNDTDHPLENVSDPVESGEDNTYYIEII